MLWQIQGLRLALVGVVAFGFVMMDAFAFRVATWGVRATISRAGGAVVLRVRP